jgi:phosphinothricin acetyltransferase
MIDGDWEPVAAIYAAGIAAGNSVFEEETPTWETFDASRLPGLRFVAVSDDRIVGWIAAAAVSARSVHRGVVEHGVHVDPESSGGVGRLLLETLITESERLGVWTVQSAIFPENTSSLALHEWCGFRIVGTRNHIGRHHGEWRDVLIVERRNPNVP